MFSRPHKWAAQAGVVAQIVLIVSFILFGFVQGPRYSWLAHSISDMYADGSPYGILLIAAVTACGLLTLLFLAFSLWPAVRKAGLSAKLATILLGLSIFGIGDLLSPFERLGCRMVDAGCTEALQTATSGGRNDAVLSTIGILFFILGAITLGYSIRKLKGFAVSANVLIFGGYSILFIAIGMGMAPATVYGALERFIAILGASILAILARSCLKISE